MSEIQIEPVRGLPEELPPGERILWQGEPRPRALARHAFHIRSIAIYFSVFVVARGLTAVADGRAPGDAVVHALMVVPLAAVGLGVLFGLAWVNARTTVYTITNRRVVMRYGVAIPMTVNVPFRIIGAAAVKVHSDGTGDVPMQLLGKDRLAYLHLWPHARPWRFGDPQPMLRAIDEPQAAAQILATAMAMAVGGEAGAPAPEPTARPAAEPRPSPVSGVDAGRERVFG
mgnify:CR=1 FL=1